MIILIGVAAPFHSARVEASRDTDGRIYWPAYLGGESPPGFAIRDQIVLNSSFLSHRSPGPLELTEWSTPPGWISGVAATGSVIVTRIDLALLEAVAWSAAKRRAYSESLSSEVTEELKRQMLERLKQEFPVEAKELLLMIFFPLQGEYSDWFRFRLVDIDERSNYSLGSQDRRAADSIEDCPVVTIEQTSAPFTCLLSFPIEQDTIDPIGNVTIPIEYEIRENQGFVNWLSDSAMNSIVIRVDRSSAQVVDLIASQFFRDPIYSNLVEPHLGSIRTTNGAVAANLVSEIAVGLITAFITRRVDALR